MKKYFVSLFVMILLFTGYSQSVNAQRERAYVKDRPTPSVVVRTTAPSRNHIWVSDEWTYRGGRYENVPQHWEVPPKNRKHWVAGQWKHQAGHGNYWVAGRWN